MPGLLFGADGDEKMANFAKVADPAGAERGTK